MPQVSVSRRVAAPLSAVWEVFTDVPAAAQRLAGIEDLEVLTPGDVRVGTRWRETRTVFGRTSTEEFEVAELEPQRRYVVSSRGHGAVYRMQYMFDALGADATSVLAAFTARGSNVVAGALGAVLWPATRRTVQKMLAQDVEDLARAAEREAGSSL